MTDARCGMIVHDCLAMAKIGIIFESAKKEWLIFIFHQKIVPFSVENFINIILMENNNIIAL